MGSSWVAAQLVAPQVNKQVIFSLFSRVSVTVFLVWFIACVSYVNANACQNGLSYSATGQMLHLWVRVYVDRGERWVVTFKPALPCLQESAQSQGRFGEGRVITAPRRESSSRLTSTFFHCASTAKFTQAVTVLWRYRVRITCRAATILTEKYS
jgi:hypothetical protein